MSHLEGGGYLQVGMYLHVLTHKVIELAFHFVQ